MDVIIPKRGYNAPAPRAGVPRVPQRRSASASLGFATGVSTPSVAKPKPVHHLLKSVAAPHVAPQKIEAKKAATKPAPQPTRPLDQSFARTVHKAILLSNALEKYNQPKKPGLKMRLKSRFLTRTVLVNAAVVAILAVTGYVSFNVWQTNQNQQAFAKHGSTSSQGAAGAVSDAADVSTDPLPKNALANYKVAPTLPRAIYINKINVAARLLPMSVGTDDSMQVPGNVNDAGWYTGSAKPGETGAVVVDGHASETGTNYGLFGSLGTLKTGDQITIERGDGQKFTYVVVHMEVDPLEGLDMNKLMVPYGDATQGLNLITCTGKWTKDHTTLDHRLLVFATPVTP